MYLSDDEPEVRPDVHIDVSAFARTRKIRVGIIEYEVPTVEYVARLEQLIADQARLIDKQKGEILRLGGFMNSTRSFIRRQTSRVAEMQNSLEGKLDLRDAI